MSTVAAAAKSLRESTDVRELARQLLPGWTWHEGHELHGACPKCGGKDRFYVAESYAACRQCHEQRMDAAGLVSWLRGVSMRDAVRELDTGALAPVRVHVKTPENAGQAGPSQALQRALAYLPRAQVRLHTQEGAAARAYLAQRGLTPATWDAFGIGFVPRKWLPVEKGEKRSADRAAPALVWPVYDEQTRQPCVVRYRYLPGAPLDAKGEPYRYDSFGSMSGRLFGVQALPEYVLTPLDDRQSLHAEQTRCLVICEGELNAMSVWQACHSAGVDVLSTGSESVSHLPGWSVDVAAHYGVVLTWFDKPGVAAKVASQLPRATAVRSLLKEDGEKQDANDLLVRGVLGALVQTLRLQALPGAHERESVLWQLWDVKDELDAGQVQAGRRLAHELGRQWTD